MNRCHAYRNNTGLITLGLLGILLIITLVGFKISNNLQSSLALTRIQASYLKHKERHSALQADQAVSNFSNEQVLVCKIKNKIGILRNYCGLNITKQYYKTLTHLKYSSIFRNLDPCTNKSVNKNFSHRSCFINKNIFENIKAYDGNLISNEVLKITNNKEQSIVAALGDIELKNLIIDANSVVLVALGNIIIDRIQSNQLSTISIYTATGEIELKVINSNVRLQLSPANRVMLPEGIDYALANPNLELLVKQFVSSQYEQ